MTIYIVNVEDSHGNLVDQELYHEWCAPDESEEDFLCAHESDHPLRCHDCRELLGNPLTSDGAANVRAIIAAKLAGWEEFAEMYPTITIDQ